MVDIIKKEKLINSNIEKVWDALTNTEKIAKWFMKNEFDTQVGGKFKLIHENEEGESCGQVQGKILEIEKPNKLVYDWNMDESDATSKVIWTLKENGDKTLVTLEHVNFDVYGDKAEDIRGKHDMGWDKFFGSFKDYCENE